MPSEKLDCPKCWVEMKKKEVEVFGPDIEIDVCPKCMGIFLDDGELKKLVKDDELTGFLTEDIGTQSKSELICPRCGSLMDIEEAEEIEVDVCLNCHGVWLDAGELEELKELSEEGYELDEDAKMKERYEEMVYKSKHSLLGKFIRKLSK